MMCVFLFLFIFLFFFLVACRTLTIHMRANTEDIKTQQYMVSTHSYIIVPLAKKLG